ncbi:molybdate ABC transporter substrate-binding protein [Ramlibacter sp. PS4R-6]|uniref:molybdate ABC transporter substrate-binding protein n=1 Tax=Ramlibacter sp. PS4R-6 TaxID=3133438 RepID=UPI0030B700B9
MALKLLSGGAAQALVGRMKGTRDVQGTFGAVGTMRDKLLAGEPCDVVILTQALIATLTQQGHVVAGSAAPLGVVKTGIAVRKGERHPDVSTAQALKAALQRAPGIYFPDPEKATAGIHFMKVLTQLGLAVPMKDHLRTFPNGATAMGEMARAPVPGVIGCTQVTEILHVAGVELVGLLPKEFELATVYTAAVCTKAQSPGEAREFVQLLAGAEAAAARAACGFEA